MRAVLYVLTFLGLIALGFWAYRENYTTQAALREVRGLQREISDLRDALAVQRAEWAYLNRPTRLRELVGLNFDSLPLLPMEPGQFGSPAQVAYPAPEIPAVEAPSEGLYADGGQISGIAATSASDEEGL